MAIYKYVGYSLGILGIVAWISSGQFTSFIVWVASSVASFTNAFSGLPPEIAGAFIIVPMIIGVALYTIFF